MGIQGLLPFLDKASKPVNISQYSGATVAVDAYCWLHKGAFSCAERLARGEKCDAYVHYCMKFITMLIKNNVKPILVFDGRHLPAKAVTEKKRRESRELNRRKAAELLRQDKPDQARIYIRRCIDITHSMAVEVMQACRKINVDCITAPFEADAQLAYLNISGIADIVITEDSDLLLFGCTRVIFKMDLGGCGMMIENKDLCLPMKVNSEKYTFDKFRRMCILSGCDYLPSLPGIGLSKARKFITSTCDPDIHRALSRLGSQLNMSLNVTQEYRDSFIHAEAMFKHQPVYDPTKRKVVPLTPIDLDSPPLNLPEPLPDLQAYQLALGNLDPFTLKRICDWEFQDSLEASRGVKWVSNWCNFPSIWSQNYSPNPLKFSRLPIQRPPPTMGKQQQVQQTGHVINPPSKTAPPLQSDCKVPSLKDVVEDSDLETALMDDEKQDSVSAKRKCAENDSGLDADLFVVDGNLSPDLSQRRDKTEVAVNKLKRKRRTVIDEKNNVFSRYFCSSTSSNEEKDTPDDSQAGTNGSILNPQRDDKLKDLSNKLDNADTKPGVILSPKKNCSKENIENMFIESPESVLTDSFDSANDKNSFNLSDSISSQNSYNSQQELNSQTKQKGVISSLFKWKTKFHENFSFSKVKYQSSKLTKSEFVSLEKADFDGDRNDLHDKIPSSPVNVQSPISNMNLTGAADDSFKSPPPDEKKNKFNPFKVRPAEPKTATPSFNLLHDPVPDACTQDIDESFITSPSSLSSMRTPPTPVSNRVSANKKNNKSAVRNRSVGLSKKSSPGKPIQKSLLSMFMLQPKPKLQSS